VCLLAEDVDARLELEPARAVDEVEKRHPALPAARGQATGDAVADIGLLAVGEICVGSEEFGDRLDASERVREGIDSVGAQTVELRAPDGQQVVHGSARRHPAGALDGEVFIRRP